MLTIKSQKSRPLHNDFIVANFFPATKEEIDKASKGIAITKPFSYSQYDNAPLVWSIGKIKPRIIQA